MSQPFEMLRVTPEDLMFAGLELAIVQHIRTAFGGMPIVYDPRCPPGRAAVLGPEPTLAERARGVARQVVRLENIGMTKLRGFTGASHNAEIKTGVVQHGHVASADDPGFGYNPNATWGQPTPLVDTEAPQPDSEELAALYEARALEMEHQAADAQSPAQQAGHRAGASSFRRKAAEIRARLAK